MANRSMNKSQDINDSIDSNSFDTEIQEADLWDEMYDYHYTDESYNSMYCYIHDLND